jgi:hypothetical protein
MCGANGSIKRGSLHRGTCMIITIYFGSIDVTTPNSKLKLCHCGGLFCSAQVWISCCLIQHYFESYIYLFTMSPPIGWLWDLSKQTLLHELDQAGLPTEGNKRDLQNRFSQFLNGLPASEIESIRRRVERELTDKYSLQGLNLNIQSKNVASDEPSPTLAPNEVLDSVATLHTDPIRTKNESPSDVNQCNIKIFMD